MSNSAELEVKLVFNNEAVKEQIGEVTEELKTVGEEGEKAGEKSGEGVKKGMIEGTKEIVKMLAEFFAVKESFEFMKELAIESVEAFEDDERAVKQLAGSFLQLDQNGNSLDQINSMAAEFKDNFEAMAAATGVSSDDIQVAFQDIADRGLMSVDAAKAFTEEMAYAARAVPGGIQEISSGIEAIQMGMTKAKNPVIGMISSMGLLKGNAKDVAKQMSGMGLEEQMALVEQAVGKMSEKMKAAPMTLGQQVTSFKEAYAKVIEAVGGPIAQNLGLAIGRIKSMFFTPTGENTKLLDMIIEGATKFSEFISGAFELIQPTIDGFMSAAGYFSETMGDMWGMMDGAGLTMEDMKAAAEVIGKILGFTVVAFGTGLGAVANVFVMAIKELMEFVGKSIQGWGAALSHIPGLKGAGAAMTNAGLSISDASNNSAKQQILDKVRSVGGGDKGQLADQMLAGVRGAGGDEAKAIDEYNAAVKQRADMMDNIDRAMHESQMVTLGAQSATTEAGAAAQAQHAQAFMDAYNMAANAHDQAAQDNILKFVAANQDIAAALMFTAPEAIAGGKDAFLKNLTKVGGAKDAEMLKQAWTPDLGFKKSPETNFNGGQVFNIKQDFKDQDPDRIAVVFRQDISRAANNRAQATTSMAGAF